MSNYNFYETKTRNWDAALWSILSIGENKSRYTKGSGGKSQPMNNLKAKMCSTEKPAQGLGKWLSG